jgi:hypothetical protein
VDVEGTIRDYGPALRLLSLDLASQDDVKSLPESYVFDAGGAWLLSEWGELVWEETKTAWYAREIIPSPLPKLRMHPHFVSETEPKMGAARSIATSHLNTRPFMPIHRLVSNVEHARRCARLR